MNTNQSIVFDSWNGVFSGASSVIAIEPAFEWNQTILPGATDESIGFCANRNVSGSGILPFVVGVSP